MTTTSLILLVIAIVSFTAYVISSLPKKKVKNIKKSDTNTYTKYPVKPDRIENKWSSHSKKTPKDNNNTRFKPRG